MSYVTAQLCAVPAPMLARLWNVLALLALLRSVWTICWLQEHLEKDGSPLGTLELTTKLPKSLDAVLPRNCKYCENTACRIFTDADSFSQSPIQHFITTRKRTVEEEVLCDVDAVHCKEMHRTLRETNEYVAGSESLLLRIEHTMEAFGGLGSSARNMSGALLGPDGSVLLPMPPSSKPTLLNVSLLLAWALPL